ncbi:MAG: ABC transporter permease [Chloroflexi bacterium]|nr:ABC transporter permease [Chloroflexota bacterium]
MRAYILRRLILFFPTLLIVSFIIFAIMRIVPGDPAEAILAGPTGEGSYTKEDLEQLRLKLGLDKPLHIQYVSWLWDFVRLDMGESLTQGRPVTDELKLRFPVTFQLAVLALLTSVGIAIPIGVLAAIRQDTWVDYIFRSFAILGLAMPTFWIALLIILVLSRGFNWFPPTGFVHLWDDPLKSSQQLIWPALALGFHSNGTMLRLTRAQLLEVLREDYVRTAWAKGLRERVIVVRHALRNALLPVVTVIGLQLAALLGGTVLVENIFALPGMGRTLINAVYSRDYPVVQAFIMVLATLHLSLNLIVDIAYGWLDPRIRYS